LAGELCRDEIKMVHHPPFPSRFAKRAPRGQGARQGDDELNASIFRIVIATIVQSVTTKRGNVIIKRDHSLIRLGWTLTPRSSDIS